MWAGRGRVSSCASRVAARLPRLPYPHTRHLKEVESSEHRPVREEPRVEDHKVYALLAIPVFLVTIFIVVLLAVLGTSPRP